ncbi:hypothetical protein [Microtetraspora sp. NBRC 16547]|nr:hypothetical protein [Microtetraspora sp. NBRC 16547]
MRVTAARHGRAIRYISTPAADGFIHDGFTDDGFTDDGFIHERIQEAR